MERLFWTPSKTAIATVTGHVAGGFTLDRSIYHAALAGYHHPQPCDLGHVLAEGHKLKLTKVFWERGRLVHRTSGPLPAVGARAQLHLDAPRRELHARAHVALHLAVAAAAEHYASFAPGGFSVVGGGEARVACRFRDDPRVVVPRVVARVAELARARLDVVARWAPRDEAAKLVRPEALPLADVMPDEPTLRLVECGPQCVLPCDAPMPGHVWDVGEVKLGLLQVRADGVRFGVRVVQ